MIYGSTVNSKYIPIHITTLMSNIFSILSEHQHLVKILRNLFLCVIETLEQQVKEITSSPTDAAKKDGGILAILLQIGGFLLKLLPMEQQLHKNIQNAESHGAENTTSVSEDDIELMKQFIAKHNQQESQQKK